MWMGFSGKGLVQHLGTLGAPERFDSCWDLRPHVLRYSPHPNDPHGPSTTSLSLHSVWEKIFFAELFIMGKRWKPYKNPRAER